MPIVSKQQAQQQAKAGGVSLKREAFVEGGGLFDDFDGTIKEALFVRWDYNGGGDEGFFLAAEIQNDEEELTGEDKGKNPFIQYYSAGKLEHFVPSDDGKEAIPVGGKTGLSKSCNAYHFLISVLDSGIDFEFDSRVDILEGKRFHFKRKKISRDFKGDKKDKTKEAEGKKDSEVLCTERYLGTVDQTASAPGPGAKPGPGPVATTTTPKPTAKPGPGPKTGPPATPKPNGSAAIMPDENTVAWTAAYILETLVEAGGSHPKEGLAKGVIAWAKGQKDLDIMTRNKVIQALGNETFLSSGEELGWVFDGATLTQV